MTRQGTVSSPAVIVLMMTVIMFSTVALRGTWRHQLAMHETASTARLAAAVDAVERMLESSAAELGEIDLPLDASPLDHSSSAAGPQQSSATTPPQADVANSNAPAQRIIRVVWRPVSTGMDLEFIAEEMWNGKVTRSLRRTVAR